MLLKKTNILNDFIINIIGCDEVGLEIYELASLLNNFALNFYLFRGKFTKKEKNIKRCPPSHPFEFLSPQCKQYMFVHSYCYPQ